MKDLNKLTGLQLALLDPIWAHGEATVRDVYRAQQSTRGLALKTVGTVLRRLEAQDILAHRREGRQFVYRPRVTRAEVREAAIRATADQLFDGSVPDLVVHVLDNGHVDAAGRARIRRFIERQDP